MTRLRRLHRAWPSLVGLGLSLLLLGTGASILGAKGADTPPRSAPILTTFGDPHLTLRGGSVPFAGVLSGHARLEGTIAPSLPGVNTLTVRIELAGAQEARGGAVALVLTMPGMTMLPVRATLTATSQGYRGSVVLPMFGHYRAQVDALITGGRHTGVMSVAVPLTFASPPTDFAVTGPHRSTR